jgi:hypothetical protein
LLEVIDSICLARVAGQKSPSQTKDTLRLGDTGKALDSKRLLNWTVCRVRLRLGTAKHALDKGPALGL